MSAVPQGRVRFVVFNVVGLIGVGVQLGALAVLKSGFGMHYLWATALAVETAVLHNFVWHVKWTWRDRGEGLTALRVADRLWRFHAGNAVVSMVVNLVLMRVLTGQFGMNYLVANLLAIAAGGVVNYLVSDRLVFVAAAPVNGGDGAGGPQAQ